MKRIHQLFATTLALPIILTTITPAIAKAPVTEPADAPVLVQARKLTQQGQNAEAIATYQTLLKTPLDPAVQFTAQSELAMLYAYQKDYHNSFQLYDQLLQQQPDNQLIKLQYAEILSWDQRYRESIRYYDEILQHEPDQAQAQLGRAAVLSWDGQYNKAIAAYQKILQTQSNHEKARIGLAQIAHWQGDLDQARDQFLALRQQFPESKTIQLELAKTYYTRQEIKTALTVVDPLLKEGNQDAIALAKDMRSVQSKTEITSRTRSSKQNSFAVNQTIKFRVGDSNLLSSAQVGYGKFTQPGRDVLQHYPVRVGAEGTNHPVRWKVDAGVDIFDRLATKPFVQGQVTAQLSPTFQVGATTNYQAYKENVVTLENGINRILIQPHLFWQITPSTSLYAQYGAGFYSDGNRDGQVWAGLKQQMGDFYVSASVLNWSFAKDPKNGYFAPDNYLSYSGEVGWEGRVANAASCNLAVSVGRQSYAGNNRPENGYKAGCKVDLSPTTTIDAQYQYSSNALFTGEGRNSNENRFQINLKTKF
jgi:tetratricopeptide (TPR) repeat protein